MDASAEWIYRDATYLTVHGALLQSLSDLLASVSA